MIFRGVAIGPIGDRAVEDLSEKKSRLADAWVDPNRPLHVLPTYQIMDESGTILNEAEFPSEVRYLFHRHLLF